MPSWDYPLCNEGSDQALETEQAAYFALPGLSIFADVCASVLDPDEVSAIIDPTRSAERLDQRERAIRKRSGRGIRRIN
jgi:hypothetical protein